MVVFPFPFLGYCLFFWSLVMLVDMHCGQLRSLVRCKYQTDIARRGYLVAKDIGAEEYAADESVRH